MNTLIGKTALVTGAANGIGAAIASVFAAEGARLVLVDRDRAGLDKLREALVGRGAQAFAFPCDVTQAAEVRTCMQEVEATVGGIDVLVNNAGGSGPIAALDIEEIDDGMWAHVIALNLTSGFLFSRAVVPGMRARGFGRIINMSSTLKDGLAGPLNTLNARLPYSTSKGAIVAFTRQLAKDLAAYGITVNALAPGLVHADPEARIAKKYQSLDESSRKSMMASVPMGRPGTGQDVAAAALFLASDASAYITGDTIMVAGGV